METIKLTTGAPIVQRYEFLIYDRKYRQGFFDTFVASSSEEARALARADYPLPDFEVKGY
jgi:hypothetical protein